MDNRLNKNAVRMFNNRGYMYALQHKTLSYLLLTNTPLMRSSHEWSHRITDTDAADHDNAVNKLAAAAIVEVTFMS